MWYDFDSGPTVAVVMSGAPSGLFLLPVGATEWDWHSIENSGWSHVHQRMFRQHQAIGLEGPPAGAPALPTSVVVVPPRDRDDPGAARTSADLIAWISAAPSTQRSAYAVFFEDPDETTFGDGLFREFVACLPSETAAAEHELSPEMQRHVRRIDLRVDAGQVVALGERRDFADRYNMNAALVDLIARLRS